MTKLMSNSPHASVPVRCVSIDAEPTWFRALRDAGAARFASQGFPTTKVEAWRYTNLTQIASTPWRPNGQPDAATARTFPWHRAIELPGASRVVLVNGVPVQKLIHREDDRLIVRTLRDAIADPAECPRVQAHLGKVSRGDADDSLASLNTAHLDDGLYIRVPRGVVLGSPILMIHATVPTEHGPTSVFPRTLIIVEDGAAANIVEHALGPSEGHAVLTSAVSEIVIGAGARCEHTLLQDEPVAGEGGGTTHINTRRAVLGKDAHFGSHSLILGAGLMRSNILPTLDGEGGHTILTGIYLTRNHQHADTAIRVDHAKPSCFSRQYYRGLADSDGRGIFTGRIVVHEDAQKTDAIQNSSGLLLSPAAHITSRPQLEIYADDVRCTHGSTIGQLDEDAIFYLRARGVPEPEARAMLIRAFVGEIADRFPDAPVREWAMDRIGAWLASGSLHATLAEGTPLPKGR